MDVHTPAQRRANMAAIRGRDTKPEMVIRRLVHGMGFRYVLHSPNIPGRPDLLLPRHKKVILVHGCFWHVHRCRFGRVTPVTNAAFWATKRAATVTRDRTVLRDLRSLGFRVLVVWECQVRNPTRIIACLWRFLSQSDGI